MATKLVQPSTLSSDNSDTCFTDLLTDDVLYNIIERLPLRSRLRLARVSRRFHKLTSYYCDVDSVAVSHMHVGIKNSYLSSFVPFKSGRHNQLPKCHTLLNRLSHVSNLAIHHYQVLNFCIYKEKAFKNLRLLALPNTAFDLHPLHLWISLERILQAPKLHTLSVLGTRSCVLGKSRVFTAKHAKMIKSKHLRVLQLQGLLFGPQALAIIALKFGDTLTELRIGGVCVNTADAPVFWESIVKFKNLQTLELPPSLFTLRHPQPATAWVHFGQLKNLKQLNLYMCHKGHLELQSFLSNLPKKCTTVALVNRSGGLLQSVYSVNGHAIKVKQFPNRKIGMRWPLSCDDTRSNLYLSPFWEPPYFRQEDWQNFVMTPEMLLAQVSNAESVLPKLVLQDVYEPEPQVMVTAKESLADFHSVKSANSFMENVHTAREHSPIVEEPMDILEFLSSLMLPELHTSIVSEQDSITPPVGNPLNNFVLPRQEFPATSPQPVPVLPDITDPPSTPPPIVSTNGIQSPNELPALPLGTDPGVSTIQAVSANNHTISSTWTSTNLSVAPSLSLSSLSVSQLTLGVSTDTDTDSEDSTDSLSMDTTQRSTSPL